MDNPSNINDIKIALELHKAAKEQLAIGRQAIDRKVAEAVGLKKGDIVRFKSRYSSTEYDIEVSDVSVHLVEYMGDEKFARIRVHGTRLNKNGERAKTWRSVAELLQDVTLVRRAENNG